MDAGKLMVLALVGVGGYLGYTYVLEPFLLQQELQAKARALAAAKGISYQDALSQIGAAVCQKVVQYEQGGTAPNNLEKLGCQVAGKIAGVVVLKGGKLAVKGVVMGAEAVGSGVATGAEAVGSGVATGAKAVAHVAEKLKFWGIEGINC